MKNIFISFFFFLSISVYSQNRNSSSVIRSTNGERNAWISDITYSNLLGAVSDNTALQNALNAKQNSLGTGVAGQFLSYDLSWKPIPASTWGNITGTLSSQTDLQTALNAKQNSLGNGISGQFLAWDQTWRSIPASSWGNITGILSAQTDLQNALNAKENTISNGLAGQYFGYNKTWQSFPNYMYMESPQGLQDTSITHSKIFYGRQATSGGGFEDYITFSPRTANQSFQLQYGHVYNEFYLRGWKPGGNYWQPWRKLVFASDMDTANTRITNYINTQIGIKTATVGYTFTEERADVTTSNFNLYKFGNVVNFNFGFYRTAADADNTFVTLGTLPVGSRPTQYTYGTITSGNGTEVGQVSIDTNGTVNIFCGIANQTWYGNLTWILFTP